MRNAALATASCPAGTRPADDRQAHGVEAQHDPAEGEGGVALRPPAPSVRTSSAVAVAAHRQGQPETGEQAAAVDPVGEPADAPAAG